MATHDPKETQFRSHLLQSGSKSQSDDEELNDAMFMSSSDDDGDFLSDEEDEDVEIPKSSLEDCTKTGDLQLICLICSKGFSSGKALSGHSRIHTQPSKKQQLGIKNKHSQNPNYNNLNNTCFVCGKSFPSEKSLFGHMRCHPDRNWRGILPPSPTTSVAGKYLGGGGEKNGSSSTLSEAELVMPAGGRSYKIRTEENRNQIIDSASTTTRVDLVEEPLQWLSKAIRGRLGTKEHTRMCSEPVADDDVVRNLMMLAEGKFDENVETMQKRKRRKLKFRDLDTFNGAAARAGVDHQTNPENRYRCGTCGKSFPTHQALGGHRSSHNKIKKINTSNMVILRNDHVTELQCTDEVIACSSRLQKEVATSTSPHKCKLCNKSYATGQALGGHMSYHGTSSSSQAVASSGEASNTGRGEVDFDLNEVPEVEVEVEDDEILQGTL